MSIFTETLNSDGKETAVQANVRWCICVLADGCPFEARLGRACEFHEMAQSRYWPEVTIRAKKYAPLMELYNLCFSRHNKTFKHLPGWITDEEKDYIAKLTAELGIKDLLPYEGEIVDRPYPGIETRHKELPQDFGLRVLFKMQELIVPVHFRKGYKPPPPNDEDEDFPF